MRKCAIVLAAAMLAAAGCSEKPSLTSSDPKERARAIQAAVKVADEKTVEQVVALTRNEDVQTAASAVAALGRMSSPRAAETLRQVVAADTRAEVRLAAVQGLSQRTEPKAVEALRETLVRDPAPEVRGEAALGLAKAGTIEDVPVLAGAVGREADPKVARKQELAMEYLIGVRFPPPDPTMTPAQRRERVQRIRTTAMRLAEARKNKIPLGNPCKDNASK
jgi:HEAT repeat protein